MRVKYVVEVLLMLVVAGGAEARAKATVMTEDDFELLVSGATRVDDALIDDLTGSPATLCEQDEDATAYEKAQCTAEFSDRERARKGRLLVLERPVEASSYDIAKSEFNIALSWILSKGREREDEPVRLLYSGRSILEDGATLARLASWVAKSTKPRKRLRIHVPAEFASQFEESAVVTMFFTQRRRGTQVASGQAATLYEPVLIGYVDLVGVVVRWRSSREDRALAIEQWWPGSPSKWLKAFKRIRTQESLKCRGGRVQAGEPGECCWPGQNWDGAYRACAGAPDCPDGLIREGHECRQDPHRSMFRGEASEKPTFHLFDE